MSPPSAAEVSLEAYHDRLARHDWWHDMSADYSITKAGRAELSQLKEIAKQSVKHQMLFDAWSTYKGGKGPKPLRPGGPSLSRSCINPEEV